MEKPTLPRRLVVPAAAFLLAALLSVPMLLRALHPSIYADDVVRIGELREPRSAGNLLFAPFNEHMAPLFQTVTLATWNAAGQSLRRAPHAFTLASFIPHILSLILLGLLIKRETKSLTTALVAVPVFGLSGLISESFSWYSASSFSWALLGTLAAIECTGRAVSESTKRGMAWPAGSILAAFAAPAFSAIGLLAGPLACVRLGLKPRLRSLLPMIGTLAYFALCLPFRYNTVVSQSIQHKLDFAAAIRNLASAPVEVLLPGLLGRRNLVSAIPDALAISLTSVLFTSILFWAWKDRTSRSLIWLSLGLIVGGYGLAFGFRSAEAPSSLRNVQRYQLFPQVGLVLLLAIVGRRLLSRFDRSSLESWTIGLGSAAMVLLLQIGMIREHARFYHWPDQPRTLAAIEKLAETCEQDGISRKQCLASLEPVRNRWFDFEHNALILLPQSSWSQKMPDTEARARLLASLDMADRESLFGGMDVSNHFIAAHSFRPNGIPAVPALSGSFEMSETERPDFWLASGWASFLEYEFPAHALDDAVALSIAVNGPVELWWSPDGRNWTEAHSVRWRAEKSTDAIDRVVFLSDLPHWNPDQVRRIRIAPRESGPLAIGTPKLLR